MLVVLVLGILFAASTIAQAHHQDGHAQGGANGDKADSGNNGKGNSAGGNENNNGNGNNGNNGNGNNGNGNSEPKPNNKHSGGSGSEASDSHNDDNKKRDTPAPPTLPDPKPPVVNEPIQELPETIEETVEETVKETVDESVDETVGDSADKQPEAPHGQPKLPVGDIKELPIPDDAEKDDTPADPQDKAAPEKQPEPTEPAPKEPITDPITEKDPLPEPETDRLAGTDPVPVGLEPLPFTYWVEGSVIFVLADPIFIGDVLITGGTYVWDWGDGTVSEGDSFQTHHYAGGPASYTVHLTRYAADGDPTHEYTLEIDLTAYIYDDPRHIFENTKPVRSVSATNTHPAPVVESDVGQLIATVPVGPLPLFLLTALALLAGLRRRLSA